MGIPQNAAFYDATVPVSFIDDYKKTRVSYSGCDMVATITVPQLATGDNSYNPIFVVGELRTISYSIHTQDVPVRSFAMKNAKAFTSGPRTIAGSLVFSTFDRHVFRNIQDELVKRYTSETLGRSVITKRILADDLPPFNITITFANEYGNSSILTIYGVHIQDEGQVMSLDDIMTETTMSYFALDVIPMDRLIRGQRPPRDLNPNLISDDEGESPFEDPAKVGDYWVYGKIVNEEGNLPKDPTILTARAIVSGTSFDAVPDSEGQYFIYTTEQPSEVQVLNGNAVLGSTSLGKNSGHQWNIVMKEVV